MKCEFVHHHPLWTWPCRGCPDWRYFSARSMRQLSPYKLHHCTSQVDFVPDAQVTIPTRNRFNKWLVKLRHYVHIHTQSFLRKGHFLIFQMMMDSCAIICIKQTNLITISFMKVWDVGWEELLLKSVFISFIFVGFNWTLVKWSVLRLMFGWQAKENCIVSKF